MSKTTARAAARKTLSAAAFGLAAAPALEDPQPVISGKTLKVIDNLSPWLETAGLILSGADDNDTGPDDFAAHLLEYSKDVLDAVKFGYDIPAPPDAIAQGTTGKLSSTMRYSLLGAAAGLTMLQAQLAPSHPKAATALKYINQAIKAMVAGRQVAAMA